MHAAGGACPCAAAALLLCDSLVQARLTVCVAVVHTKRPCQLREPAERQG